MARISDLLAAGRTSSFEFFPPKTDEAARSLEKTIAELAPLHPSFVSVTYGAGGSTRDRTRDIVIHIQRDAGITAMAHLTCIAHDPDDLVSLLEQYHDAGIENILSLAGDPPAGQDVEPGGLRYASELIEIVRQAGDFCIGVAAHPELHPRSSGDRARDRDFLAAKLEMADFAITQFFFEPEPYLTMIDELAERGVTKPVLPGIMPVTNAGPGAAVRGDGRGRVPAARWRPSSRPGPTIPPPCGPWASSWPPGLCRELLDAGAPGLHFYTLNRSTATREIYANLGL